MARTNIHYWLALKYVPRLSVTKKITLVDHVGLSRLFEESCALSAYGLTANQVAAILKPNWDKIDKILDDCRRCSCFAIGFGDPEYPYQLKQIYDPPLVLFVKGNIHILGNEQLAIVGSRSATISGRETATRIASELVKNNIVVTSGLAIGIDGSAHKGAVNHQGRTIAVVATGLDSVYPTRHRELAQAIIDAGGAIVSEFIPGTPAKAGHFPKRNRIISGLAKGVLVVEAELRSGSLITARTALEQNRDVFAIPGNIANPQSKGCHWLIKQGAKLVEDTADIFNELEFDGLSNELDQQISFINDAVNEKKVANNNIEDLFLDPLLASVGDETTPVDIVVSRSKLPVEEVLSRLTMLELRGLVSAVPGGYQRLIKG